ncbi:MAG: efflux transporter outer membrane subunit [Pseudomonadota bacterium]
MKKRHDAGLATELDLRRAQTPLETARVDIARYQQLVAQDRNALVLLAGGPVPSELLPANLTNVGMPKDIYPDLPSAVLLRRPDVMAAEHRLRGANALIGAARAAFFPRIALTTSLGTASQNLSGLFGANSDTWSFAPAIAMPIFDPRVWAAFRASQAEQKIALTQYERAIQAAFRDTADALAVRGAIGRQVAAQRDLVRAVAETYRLTYQRYDNGIDSYLSVLDAQRSLYGAQQGLVTLRMAKLTSQVRLYAVLGGGAD